MAKTKGIPQIGQIILWIAFIQTSRRFTLLYVFYMFYSYSQSFYKPFFLQDTSMQDFRTKDKSSNMLNSRDGNKTSQERVT